MSSKCSCSNSTLKIGCSHNNVCDTQDTFNYAFYKALSESRKKDKNRISATLCTYMVLHFIFLVWGIMLAFRSQPKNNRVVHITLATVFGPAYVLSYYLDMLE
jgi:hypothetical protein